MDVFFQGVEVTVMGFIVVIAVLAFICFVLMIFNFIANLENKKAKDTNKITEKPNETKTVNKISTPVVQERLRAYCCNNSCYFCSNKSWSRQVSCKKYKTSFKLE